MNLWTEDQSVTTLPCSVVIGLVQVEVTWPHKAKWLTNQVTLSMEALHVATLPSFIGFSSYICILRHKNLGSLNFWTNQHFLYFLQTKIILFQKKTITHARLKKSRPPKPRKPKFLIQNFLHFLKKTQPNQDFLYFPEIPPSLFERTDLYPYTFFKKLVT